MVCGAKFSKPCTEVTRSGKYVGNRPVKLKKADTSAVRPVEIGHRKAKQLDLERKKNSRKKPY